MRVAVTTDTHYGYDGKTHEIHTKFLKRLREACDAEKVDALIHCGDWIANNQHQLPRTWKMFRDAMGELPILSVEGNHCHWDQEFWNNSPTRRRHAKHPAGMSLPAMGIQHSEWAEEFGIHLLGNGPKTFADTVFYGFNGWYNVAPPNTNDPTNMAKIYESSPSHVYLRHKADKDLDRILLEMESCDLSLKKVCVTHFPPYSKDGHLQYCANPRYLDFITEKFDLLLVGHSHRKEDWVSEFEGNTCRVVNPGTNYDQYSGGYNKPNFIILDI